jgi:CSLREA domain-containing protein
VQSIRILGLAGVVVFAAATASAQTFTVNSTLDLPDTNIGDGVCFNAVDMRCTLRAAVQEINASGAADTIDLAIGTYELDTIGGSGEDAAATGDLDVTSTITILGEGAGASCPQAGTTCIQAGGDGLPQDRVFDVLSTGNLTLEDLTVADGDVSGSNGGGVRNHGIVRLERCEVRGNEADVGGGLYSNGTSASVIDSTFVGNDALAGAASGIHAESGSLSVENSTFSGELDTALRSVDALTTLTHVSIQGALGNGLAASPSTSSITIENSLVVGSGVADCAFSGSPALIQPNLGTLDSDFSCAPFFSITDPTPMLAPLALNGGSTENHEPEPGSGAIDLAVSADCLPFDQRGLARPDGVGGVGFCDIGSVEVLPEPAALPLGLAGLALVGALARRKRR